MKSVPFLPTAVALAALVVGVLASTATAQDASDSATGTVEISQAVRSVTVSPNTFQFDQCVRADGSDTDGLTFPNGRCTFLSVTIENGDEPAHIHVRAENFTGSEGGQWTLVDGSAGDPGEDEAMLWRSGHPDEQATLTVDECDILWNPEASGDDRCLASPGQGVVQGMLVIGPSASTNTSPSWSTTITWTAMP